MRKFLLVVIGLMICASAHAGMGRVEQVFNATDAETQTVIYSRGFKIPNSGYFGVWYKTISDITAAQFVSAGQKSGIDVKIELQQSYNDVDGNYVEPSDLSDIETNWVAATSVATSTGTWNVKSLSLDPMAYVRFKVTGNTNNNTNTTITMYLFSQE